MWLIERILTNSDEYESGLNIAGSSSIQKYTQKYLSAGNFMSKHSHISAMHLVTTLFQADQAVQFYYMSMAIMHKIFATCEKANVDLNLLCIVAKQNFHVWKNDV